MRKAVKILFLLFYISANAQDISLLADTTGTSSHAVTINGKLINYYLREELNFKTDIKYHIFGPVHPWDNSNDETREDLRQAMVQLLISTLNTPCGRLIRVVV